MSNVIDLPEPRRRPPASAAEKQQRQWRVLTTILWLVIGYAFIHKVGVPFVLKFTRLASSPYAELDWWFALPLALGLSVRAGNFWLVSFCAGGGIVYGAVETILSLKGVYPGWLGISKLLSSAPFAGVCIAMMSGPYPQRVTRAAWYGVSAVATVRIVQQIWEVW